MAFGLSFSEEFYVQEGDFELGPDESLEPTSVYRALLAMTEDEWKEMCREVFPRVDIDIIDCSMVLDKIRETDTCSDLSSPVTVWIDEEGFYTIDVYDPQDLEDD